MEEGWERTPRLELSLAELHELIEPAFPGAAIEAHAAIETGLANTNLRFRLRGHERSYVLRLHTRDLKAAARERALLSYLAQNPLPPIPTAPLIYSDPVPERGRHPYSIWGFVEGTLLQELFKTLPSDTLIDIAHSCGKVAAAIATHQFPKCGELGPSLVVVEEYGAPSQFVPAVVHRALFGGIAGQRLGATLRDSLWAVVDRTSPLLSEIDDRYTLVHADFKRSNLLLSPAAGSFRVSAVLDWEFAFAGPPLIDVGLFLRAGKALPPGFRDAFANGYRAAGGYLPSEWLRLSRLVDLLSQITFLDDPRDRPQLIAETTTVIEETVEMFG